MEATNPHGSLITIHINVDRDDEDSESFTCPMLPDESLLQRHLYFVFRLNCLHTFQILDRQGRGGQDLIPVGGYLGEWLVIPRHKYLAQDPAITRTLISRMGVTQDLIDYFAPKISSFLVATAEDPCLAGSNIIALALTVISVTPFNSSELDVELAMRESAEAFRTVPATRPSIEELKDVKIEKNGTSEDQNCTICLEKLFSLEVDDHEDDHKGKVLSMPCSHLYHKDCIVQWLETSHLCPLCRCAMPASECGSN